MAPAQPCRLLVPVCVRGGRLLKPATLMPGDPCAGRPLRQMLGQAQPGDADACRAGFAGPASTAAAHLALGPAGRVDAHEADDQQAAAGGQVPGAGVEHLAAHRLPHHVQALHAHRCLYESLDSCTLQAQSCLSCRRLAAAALTHHQLPSKLGSKREGTLPRCSPQGAPSRRCRP